MSSKNYPEIEKLGSLQKAYQLHICPKPGIFMADDDSIKAIVLRLQDRNFDLFVYDEYNDLQEDNQLLALCLVLRELEEYAEAEDYLSWCRERGSNPANEEARSYHMRLGAIYREIEQRMGTVDSQISDIDFQLNAGAAQWLRDQGKK